MMEVIGLLDSASSVSFVTERIVQTLRMPRSACDAKFSGIAGMTHSSTVQAVATSYWFSQSKDEYNCYHTSSCNA